MAFSHRRSSVLARWPGNFFARVGAPAAVVAAVDFGGDALDFSGVTPFEIDRLRDTARRANRGERDHTRTELRGGQRTTAGPGVRSSDGLGDDRLCHREARRWNMARSSQTNNGASMEQAIQITLWRVDRNERSDIGEVNNNQTPTAPSASGSASSNDKCTTIGTTTTATIKLQ